MFIYFLSKLIQYDSFVFKGTVSVISSDPPSKDGNARFTTLCLIKYELVIHILVYLNCLLSFVASLQNAHFLPLQSNG